MKSRACRHVRTTLGLVVLFSASCEDEKQQYDESERMEAAGVLADGGSGASQVDGASDASDEDSGPSDPQARSCNEAFDEVKQLVDDVLAEAGKCVNDSDCIYQALPSQACRPGCEDVMAADQVDEVLSAAMPAFDLCFATLERGCPPWAANVGCSPAEPPWCDDGRCRVGALLTD